MNYCKLSQQAVIDRRVLLGASAAASLQVLPWANSLATATEPVQTLLLAPLVQGPLHGLLEKHSNNTISNGTFLSSTDTLAKLMAPGASTRWDVMMALTELARSPVLGQQPGQERAHPIDPSVLTNLNSISEGFKSDIIKRGDAIYAVPFYWGYDTVLYNKDHVPETEELLNSWGLIFEDKYSGRVAWQDEPYYTLMIAGLYLGHPTPESATKAEVDEFAKFLISKKKNVRAFWQTAAQAISLMATGEVVAMHGQIPARVGLQRRGMNVTNNWPKEGVVVWSGVMFVPKSSETNRAGQSVINAALSAEYGAALTKETGYLSVNGAAENLLSDEDRAAAGYDIYRRNLKIHGYKFPPDINIFVEAWGRVKRA